MFVIGELTLEDGVAQVALEDTMTLARKARSKSQEEADVPKRAGKKKRRDYEFGAVHDKQFTALAGKMIFVGVAGIGWVLFAAITGAIQFSAFSLLLEVSTLAQVMAFVFAAFLAAALAVAIWTLRAAFAFRSIARTTGRDINYLMAAVRDLDRLFLVQLIFAVLALSGFALTLLNGGGEPSAPALR